MGKGLLVQKVALGALHRRVANHSGGAADQGVGLVAASLEVLQYHYAHEVSYVEGVPCRVDSDIGGHRPFSQLFFGPGGDIVYHPAPFQFFYKILHRMII